jgi:hypothetical protein
MFNQIPRESLLRGPIETAMCRALGRLPSPLDVLQNDTAPMIIDNAPFLDLLQGSQAADTD